MKRVFLVLVFASTTVVAQNARVQPAPRLTDGKPDLTGVFRVATDGTIDYQHPPPDA